MLIDLHMHSKEGSPDSVLPIKDMVIKAKKIGLDAICITDHDNIDVFDYAKKIGHNMNFNILVGSEILTYEGDILVYGVRDLPKKKLHAWELTEYVSKRGGATIAAHPFRHNNRGLGELLHNMPYLDGVEVFNGSTKAPQNLYAYAVAIEKGYALSGASDWHSIDKMGTYCTYVKDSIFNEAQLVNSIKSKQTLPCVLENGIYRPLKAYGQYGIAI